jgi:predicted DNA-binding transcriptional regulator AlpA
MKEENKRQLIDSYVADSEYYRDNIKKIKETLEEFDTESKKLAYLNYVKKRIEFVLTEFDIIKAENTELDDANDINIKEIAIYKVADYVDLLYYKFNKQLELLGDGPDTEVDKRNKEIVKCDVSISELPDEIKHKLELLLTAEEQVSLNKFIKEKERKSIPQTLQGDDVLLKKKEVMRIFSVSQVTINDWMKKGKIPFTRILRRVFFKKSDIDEILSTKPNLGRKGKNNQ